MKPLLIIKLGGSVISYKDSSLPKVRIEVIKRIAKEISQILSEKKFHLVIVHGVGSFGHPLAKKHNLVNGMVTEEQKMGYCLMEQQNFELHLKIITSLINNNVPAISLPPHSFIKTKDRKFSGFNMSIIKSFLDQGLVPILLGDGVVDEKQGCSVLSGDVILPYLAKKLHAKKAIFLSDVDGVFDKDPKKNPEAKVIPEISDKNLDKILDGLTPNNINDVSGEMKGKVLSIKNNLNGLPVYIINGLKTQAILKVVHGQAIGTQLLFC